MSMTINFELEIKPIWSDDIDPGSKCAHCDDPIFLKQLTFVFRIKETQPFLNSGICLCQSCGEVFKFTNPITN